MQVEILVILLLGSCKFTSFQTLVCSAKSWWLNTNSCSWDLLPSIKCELACRAIILAGAVRARNEEAVNWSRDHHCSSSSSFLTLSSQCESQLQMSHLRGGSSRDIKWRPASRRSFGASPIVIFSWDHESQLIWSGTIAQWSENDLKIWILTRKS
jgi:hypothetical protein